MFKRIGYVSRFVDISARGKSRSATQIDSKIRAVKADKVWIELDKLIIKGKTTGIDTKTVDLTNVDNW
jgi:anaerobic ribonucleoside-triphosphate reductase